MIERKTVGSKGGERTGYFCKETGKANGLLVSRYQGKWQGKPFDKVVVNKLLQSKGTKEWKFLLKGTPGDRSRMMLSFNPDVIPEFIECLKKIYEDFYGAEPVNESVRITREANEMFRKALDELDKPEKTAMTEKDKELLGL